MKKRGSKLIISLVLCFLLSFAHFNSITAFAAPLNTRDSQKILAAINSTLSKSSGTFSKNMTGGTVTYIRSFSITNVEAPQNGKLLDGTATVVADNGVSWDIPVIWVDKDGSITKVGIEIDTVRTSYPIFVFYMPEGYSLLFGEKAAYNIEMPQFVVDLFKRNGVTVLSIPEAGRTYISAVLPESTGFKMNVPAPEPSSDGEGKEADPGGGSPGNINGNHKTKPTDNSTTPPESKASAEKKAEITNAHCSQEAIDVLGVDKLADLITWIKETLEPEATNLLVKKFPAYKEGVKDGELAKDLGLYIYYDSSSTAMASVKGQVSGETESARLEINASYFYVKNEETGEYEFDGSTKYSDLDNTLVHEMMHAFMNDYTRAGMFGQQLDEATGSYNLNPNVEFPDWFAEGMASTVDNTYQYRHGTILNKYGYNQEGEEYDAAALLEAYKGTGIKLTGGSTESNYISGYLASLYLGYLAGKTLGKDAISGSAEKNNIKVKSDIILKGENYILESLHDGKTLDEIIAEISKVDGTSLYTSTADFESKFIMGGTDESADPSLDFCINVLNYLEENSSDEDVVNGSVLLDFTDTNPAQLRKSLLSGGQKVYVLTDDKEYAASTVAAEVALDTGGTSETGIKEATDSQQKEQNSDPKVMDDTNSETDTAAAKEAETDQTAEATEETVDDQESVAETPAEEPTLDSIASAIDMALGLEEEETAEAEEAVEEVAEATESEAEVKEENAAPAKEDAPAQPTVEKSEAPAQQAVAAPETPASSETPAEQNDSQPAPSKKSTAPEADTSEDDEPQAHPDDAGTVDTAAETPAENGENAQEAVEQAPAEASEPDVVTVDVIEEPAPAQNDLIISESAPEPSSGSDDGGASEQVLDAMPEAPSNDNSSSSSSDDAGSEG